MPMLSSTTNFGVLPLVWQLSVALLAFVPAAWAATAMCEPGWEWANNSEGQNPCQVAGYLQAPCLGFTTYVLGPLSPGQVYTAPAKNDTKGLKCDCNTVIYSLYSACEACQNATTKPWAEWNENCDSVYVAQYPFNIPGVTAIPRWAFINITEGGSFDVTAAQNAGRDPEALGNDPVTLNLSSTSSSGKLSTSTTSSHLPPPVSSSSPAPLPTNGNDLNGATSNGNNVSVIVGGVIAGVVGLGSLSLLLLWLYLRRRPDAPLPFASNRPLSHRTLSIRSRGSYYPPTVPAYKYESEMENSGWKFPQSRPNVPSREELTLSPTEFDVQTTYNSPPHTGGRRYNPPLEF